MHSGLKQQPHYRAWRPIADRDAYRRDLLLLAQAFVTTDEALRLAQQGAWVKGLILMGDDGILYEWTG